MENFKTELLARMDNLIAVDAGNNEKLKDEFFDFIVDNTVVPTDFDELDQMFHEMSVIAIGPHKNNRHEYLRTHTGDHGDNLFATLAVWALSRVDRAYVLPCNGFNRFSTIFQGIILGPYDPNRRA